MSKPPMLTLFTNVGASGSPASFSVPEAGYSANEKLVDVVTCNAVTADSKGGVSAQSGGGLPMVS